MARAALPSQTLRGVAFPIDGEAEEQLRALKAGGLNYVQLSVDTLNEAIKLEKAATVKVGLRLRLRGEDEGHFSLTLRLFREPCVEK